MKLLRLLCGCMSVVSLGVAAAGFPEARLANDDIEMAIYLPDPEKGSYQSVRFDWSGLIHSLKYQGVEYFGPWRSETVHDPLAHFSVNGPAQIFDNLGYGESDSFVRIGVGLLEKPIDEQVFRFTNSYHILDHGEWNVETTDNQVSFTQTLNSDIGYGYAYHKTVRLDDQGFTMKHRIDNTGEKAIETTVFNHHFFVIDDQVVDENYRVIFPFDLSRRKRESRIDLKGGDVQILEAITDENRLFVPMTGFSDSSSDHQFRIHHESMNRGIEVQVDQPLQRLVIWANDKSLSPENFINVNVPVGESFSWTAEYRVY